MAPNLELKVLIRCAPLSEMIFSVRADRLIALLLLLQSRGRESRSTHSRGEVVAGALLEVLELI